MLKPAPLQTDLTRAHQRFARAALAIYLGSALIALGVLVAFLFADLAQERDQIRANLLTEVETRETYLRRHLALLLQELRRLALRSEVDSLDQNQSPEQRLLQVSHEGSTFFNLGVAIVDQDGAVTASMPQEFMARGRPLTQQTWFERVKTRHELAVVPVLDGVPSHNALYLVTPILRNGRFDGAFIGGLDLARSNQNVLGEFGSVVEPVLATRHGAVVFPPTPPPFVDGAAWKALFDAPSEAPLVTELALPTGAVVVAEHEVHGTDLVLLLSASERDLFGAATTRIQQRLGLAFVLAALPFIALVWLLQRSLRVFRTSGERFVREERLRRVGEASNLIAHEVKNALNGIRMAAELACENPGARTQVQERALTELRSEIQRLANFTAELMTFSKGITVRQSRFWFGEFISKVVSLAEKTAQESCVSLRVHVPSDFELSADPQLLHIVIYNLVINAIESAAARGGAGSAVTVDVEAAAQHAHVVVRDNGAGVSPSMLPRLFEPFESGKASGVGIGLALARRIAEAHAGSLVLLDNQRGAAFRLSLPRSSA